MFLFILVVTFSGAFALQWTSSTTIPNGKIVDVCVGDNISFQWTFNTTSSEHVSDIEWYMLSEGQQEVLLATYIGNQFVVVNNTGRPINFVPNAGIDLPGVTSADKGKYSVRIYLRGDLIYSQTAILQVIEPAEIATGSLRTYILYGADFPSQSGESQLQLACGQFSSLGQPPVNVVWKTPSNHTISSSSYNNGMFVLALPNYMETGHYTCILNGTTLAEKCLENNFPLLQSSSIYVGEDEMALYQLQSRIRTLTEENIKLQATVTDIQTKYEDLQQLYAICARPTSCLDLKQEDAQSGVHTVYPNVSQPIDVYCDQTTGNGGWTVIQRRQDGSVDFFRNWTEYETGFGILTSEFWIGLEKLHLLTKGRSSSLRIDMMDFNNTSAYAVYDTFYVSGAEDNYRLNISGYHGTAEDSLSNLNYKPFSTHDRDHDTWISGNCADECHGGWWYVSCTNSNLNGLYTPVRDNHWDAVFWYTWRGMETLKHVEMKIRP